MARKIHDAQLIERSHARVGARRVVEQCCGGGLVCRSGDDLCAGSGA